MSENGVPRRYDFHIHTSHSSDCMMRPEGIVRAARRRGLAGIAVTDHGTVKGGHAVRALKPPDLLVIVGAEIYTRVGDLVCLFIEEEVKAKDPFEVIARTRNQGGLVFFPHPLQSHPQGVAAEVLAACDGYEVLNARAGWFAPDAPENATEWSPLKGKTRLGNSDAHLYSDIGRAYTHIPGPATPDNVQRAIREGDTEPGGERGPISSYYASRLIKMYKKRDLSAVGRFARHLLRGTPLRPPQGARPPAGD